MGVIATIDALGRIHGLKIKDETIKKGIENLNINFPILGRWQTLCEQPLTICDTGHNEDGLKYVTAQLKRQNYRTLRIVLAMVADKDVDKVLGMFDKTAVYYLSKADIPRGLAVELLAQKAARAGLTFRTFPSVKEALRAAQSDAAAEDLIFVGGSTYTVAEIV